MTEQISSPYCAELRDVRRKQLRFVIIVSGLFAVAIIAAYALFIYGINH